MSDSTSVSFTSPCPQGHIAEQHFEIATLQFALDNDTVQFYCSVCDEFWLPCEEEKRKLNEWLRATFRIKN